MIGNEWSRRSDSAAFSFGGKSGYAQNEIGDGCRIAEIEDWQRRVGHRVVGGNCDDVRIAGRKRFPAFRLETPQFDFRHGLTLVTLDQHEVARRKTTQYLLKARFALLPEFVHDRKALAGDDRHFERAGLPMTEGIGARLVYVEVVMGMLDR